MIGKEVVKKVAAIARLELTKKELDQFSKDMGSILNAFKTLDKVDTKTVKPTFQPVDMRNVTRDDVVEPGMPKKEALANTDNKEEGHFKGPKVL